MSTTIILVILLVLALVIVGIVLSSRTSGGANGPSEPSPSVQEVLRTPLRPEVRDRVLELTRRGQRILAIKELREATGYGLRDAKEVVDALVAGRGPRSTLDRDPNENRTIAAGATHDTGLADRARQLQGEGREVQAIRLVCDETGMSITEAQSFVRALQS